MPRRSPPPPMPPDQRDEEIRHLRDELYFACEAIIDLVSKQFEPYLSAWLYCESLDDLNAWESWVVDGVLRAAVPGPAGDRGDYLDRGRAYCPLCGGSAQSPYSRGFSVPLGLERHLEGSHGSRRCPVLRVVATQCRDSVPRSQESPAVRARWAVTDRPRPWDEARAKTQADAPAPSATIVPFPKR